MMSEGSSIRASGLQNYLLVEGKDDEHVFYSLLKYHQIPDGFKIKNKGSVENILDTLDVELIDSNLGRLGIVVDADFSVAARWEAIRGKLINSGYIVPETPECEGTIIEQEGRPIVGIWLMPDNIFPGMLEHFVSLLIPSDDLLWPLAEDTLQKVIERDRRFRESYLMKAKLHTWLAWQERPGTPPGLALTNRYLDANALYAQKLIKWLCRLFALESSIG
jgi:hypothetical protein